MKEASSNVRSGMRYATKNLKEGIEHTASSVSEAVKEAGPDFGGYLSYATVDLLLRIPWIPLLIITICCYIGFKTLEIAAQLEFS